MDFCIPPLQYHSRDKPLVSKIVLKVVQEDFGNTCKKIILIAFAVFLMNSFKIRRGGGTTTPQMQLTVKIFFTNIYLLLTYYHTLPN